MNRTVRPARGGGFYVDDRWYESAARFALPAHYVWDQRGMRGVR